MKANKGGFPADANSVTMCILWRRQHQRHGLFKAAGRQPRMMTRFDPAVAARFEQPRRIPKKGIFFSYCNGRIKAQLYFDFHHITIYAGQICSGKRRPRKQTLPEENYNL